MIELEICMSHDVIMTNGHCGLCEDAKMDLTNLLDEISERGWLVNNLFQLDNGTWQANLRTSTHHTAWGRGPTPVLALSIAMDGIEAAEPSTIHEVESAQSITFGPETSAALAQILANLRPSRPPLFTQRLR